MTPEREEELREAAIELALHDEKTVLSLPEGRRFVWRLLEQTGLWARTYTERENGRRDVGIEVLERLQATLPREWATMVQEATQTDVEAILRAQAQARPSTD